MKKKRNNLFPLYIILGLVIFVGGIVWVGVWKQSRNIYPTKMQEEIKVFESKNFKVQLKLPSTFSINERLTFIDFESENNEKINLSRIATNFESLDNYLIDFDSKRNIEVLEESLVSFNNLEVKERIELLNQKTKEKQKIYFIYKNNWVYSLSTSFESLYTDLDHIAQSFRYTP